MQDGNSSQSSSQIGAEDMNMYFWLDFNDYIDIWWYEYTRHTVHSLWINLRCLEDTDGGIGWLQMWRGHNTHTHRDYCMLCSSSSSDKSRPQMTTRLSGRFRQTPWASSRESASQEDWPEEKAVLFHRLLISADVELVYGRYFWKNLKSCSFHKPWRAEGKMKASEFRSARNLVTAVVPVTVRSSLWIRSLESCILRRRAEMFLAVALCLIPTRSLNLINAFVIFDGALPGFTLLSLVL